MNSILGTIELGAWELGQVQALGITSGAFLCTADPRVTLTAAGGQQPFDTSVLGSIRLGYFQLGAVPFGSLTAQETTGKGSFQGKAFPDVIARPPVARSGEFTCTAFPAVHVRGNKGPLLVVLSFFPDCTAADIAYYADGSFTCATFPDVVVSGIKPGAMVCKPFPAVRLSPNKAQLIDCVAGPGTPTAEPPPNYVY